ncbi:MAG: ankyrin repeat domain-containing protein [Thiomicrorhabdus sp.]|nr:ankyrin repeat domain-containing protein [Thiomicrorhabdus sp.]
MFNVKKTIALTTGLLLAVLSGCELTGNTMKLSNFFEPDMIELITAIEKNDELKARSLIDQGLSLNVHGNEGITPLFWFTINKDKAAMRLAMKLGADPDFSDPDGDTPLAIVVESNDDEMLLILLEGGANPNTIDSDGQPVMFPSVANDRKEQLDMLIKFGGDINLTDKMNKNSAMYGVRLNKFKIVHYLIEKGVEFDKRSSLGGDIAWSVHDKLSRNLLNPESDTYDWALKVKQQLLDRGVKFPPPSPFDVRWSKGNPDSIDIDIRKKDLKEEIENTSDQNKREALQKELEAVKKLIPKQ